MPHALAVCTGVQDIREVQKEINMANDTLARTDRIADEKIFKVLPLCVTINRPYNLSMESAIENCPRLIYQGCR